MPEPALRAFTFYRQPLMRAEEIGTLAASLNRARTVLRRRYPLVDSTLFDHARRE